MFKTLCRGASVPSSTCHTDITCQANITCHASIKSLGYFQSLRRLTKKKKKDERETDRSCSYFPVLCWFGFWFTFACCLLCVCVYVCVCACVEGRVRPNACLYICMNVYKLTVLESEIKRRKKMNTLSTLCSRTSALFLSQSIQITFVAFSQQFICIHEYSTILTVQEQ